MANYDELSKQLGLSAIPQPTQGLGPVTGFGASAAWSIPELFGVDAPESVQNWRAERPLGYLGSTLAGSLVPYLGWEAGAAKIPAMARALDAVTLSGRPIVSGALREATKFAPFEAARAVSESVLQPDKLVDHWTDAGVNLGIFSGFGAAGGALKAMRPALEDLTKDTQPIKNILPDLDWNQPTQLTMRSVLDKLDGLQGGAPEVGPLRRGYDALSEQVRGARLSSAEQKAGNQYVKPLEGVDDAKPLNGLFQPTSPSAKGTSIKVFDDATMPDGWVAEARNAGLPDRFEAYAQFPRLINPTEKTAEKIGETIKGATQDMGMGWRLAKEADAGLYVVAKEVAKEDAPSSWLLFKTDRPDFFMEKRALVADATVKRQAWEAGEALGARKAAEQGGADVYANLAKYREDVAPFEGIRKLDPQDPNAMSRMFQGSLKKLGFDDTATDLSMAAKAMARGLKPYFAPSQFEFSRNQLARWIFGQSKYAFDSADSAAKSLIYGDLKTPEGNLFKALGLNPLSQKEFEGGVKQMVEKLSPKDVQDVKQAAIEGWSPKDAVEQGKASPEAAKFLEAMNTLDRKLTNEVIATQEITDPVNRFIPLENHYRMTRTWEGDRRVRIVNEKGQLASLGAGKNDAAALKNAEDQIAEAAKNGRTWTIQPNEEGKRVWAADRAEDLSLAQQVSTSQEDELRKIAQRAAFRKANTPAFWDSRQGVKGYMQSKEDFGHKDLLDSIQHNVDRTYKYLAEESLRHQMKPWMQELGVNAPDLVKQLNERIGYMAGRQGQVSAAVNKFVDKALAPVLGNNSATQISRGAATYMHYMQYGFNNLTNGVVNALTFVQTTLPHVAFLMSAPTEITSKYYTWLPAMSKGETLGGVGVLDMLKLTKQSFAEMGKPSAELKDFFTRGLREGAIDPRFIEEFAGRNSKFAEQVREGLQKGDGLQTHLKVIADAVLTTSEKFSRGHTFVLGNIVGRDLMGLEGERLYQFTKEFTNNSMYLYSTADRARVLNGPVGTLYGVFKNWMFHYIGQTAVYAGEGIGRGNWSPLMWMMGGTTAMGGIGGLPLIGAANQLSKLYNDKSIFYNTYDWFGYDHPEQKAHSPSMSDGLFYGLPAFMGLSMQSSVAMPGSDVMRDASMLTSVAFFERAKLLGQTVGDSFERWRATGEHPISDADIRDKFIRAIGPRALYRAMQVTEDGQINSLMTGNPMVKDMTLGERVAYQFLGLNPTYVERSMEASNELFASQDKMKAATQRYAEAWKSAIQNGDGQKASQLLSYASATGVDVATVIRSAMIRQKIEREDPLLRKNKIQGSEYKSNVVGY